MTDFSRKWDKSERRGEDKEGWLNFDWLWHRDRKHRLLGNILILSGIWHIGILLYMGFSYLFSG